MKAVSDEPSLKAKAVSDELSLKAKTVSDEPLVRAEAVGGGGLSKHTSSQALEATGGGSKLSYAAAVTSKSGPTLSKIPWTLDRSLQHLEFTPYHLQRHLLRNDVFVKEVREGIWKPMVNTALETIESGGLKDQERFDNLNIIQQDFFQRVKYHRNEFNNKGIVLREGHIIRLNRLRTAFQNASTDIPQALPLIESMDLEITYLQGLHSGASMT